MQTPAADDAAPRNALGPYERWVYGPGRDYDLPGLLLADQRLLSCVVEYAQPLTAGQISALEEPRGRSDAAPPVCLPEIWRPGLYKQHFIPLIQRLAAPQTGDIAVINRHFDSLNLTPNPDADEASGWFSLNYPILADTFDPAFKRPKPAANTQSAPRRQVIVAIIDDGIPFAHRAFCRKDGTGTRIDYCWSQAALPQPGGPVAFGREFTRASIEAAMARHGTDEDAIYRDAGLLHEPGRPPMPLDRSHSHGAHVLGTLAGDWPDDDVHIIAVDMPSTVNWDTSGFGKDMFLLSALHYIFCRADAIAARSGGAAISLVINISYGFSGGPPDRAGTITAAMDELIAARRALEPDVATALVLPSGNSLVDRLHAEIGEQHFTGTPNMARAEIDWAIQPDDRTSNYLEFWLPVGCTQSSFAYALTIPGQATPLAFTADGMTAITPGYLYETAMKSGDDVIGLMALERYRNRLWRLVIALAPTVAKGSRASAPAGEWRLRLMQTAGGKGPGILSGGKTIQCRIQRDSSFGNGNTGARQTMFRDLKDGNFNDLGERQQLDASDPTVLRRRFGSLNGMARGEHAMVVGGYTKVNGKAAFYSGAGDLHRGADGAAPIGRQVDLACISERSQWHPGITGPGTRTGISVALQGTSSAAPQAARLLAEKLLALHPGARLFPQQNYLPLLGSCGTPVADGDAPGPNSRPRLGRLRLRAATQDGLNPAV